MNNYHWRTIVLLAGTTVFFLCGTAARAQNNSFFNADLQYGMRGSAAVAALQGFLSTEGVYSGSSTGNFLSYTLQAVKDFQNENGITPASGYFGPLTRAKANGILASYLETYQNQAASLPAGSPTTAPAANPAAVASPVGTLPAALNTTTLLQADIGALFQRYWALQGKRGSRGGGSTTTPTSTNPLPATSTLIVNIALNGGAAAISDFSIAVNDVTTASTVFSGAASSASFQFALKQGDVYAVTEATTTNSANYSVALGSSCSGTMGANTITCAITNTFIAPAASSVVPTAVIYPATLPGGTVGIAYGPAAFTVSSTANSPFSWSLISGSLPSGLVFSTSAATLSGMPAVVGTSTFAIKATNGTSSSTRNYAVNIAAAPVIPTSTSQNKLLWGAYVGDIDATPSLVASFDTLTNASSNIIASFMDLASGDFPSSEKSVVGAKGKTLLLFFEPQYSFDQLNSGSYDSVLQQYASAAAAYGYPIILAPFDEFNLNENPWGYSVGGNTPAKFIQAWQHIHGFFVNVPNVKFALIYNNVGYPADSVNTYAAYYPGSAYVDYAGVDGFNFNASNATAQSFDQIFNPIMPVLQAFNKPILFASIGSLDYSQKSQWITYGLGTYVKQFPNVLGWVYFNYNDTSAGQNWRVDTSSSSLAAFKAVIPR